ncbi:UDP-N-acetylmuramoyl-L-alanine--D-glutamate ligase [Aquimonas sp.]|uniref:UDP-N-acetylmuramoyl-L-alanine--D-glutamate ligase n=1 Tax=Aquimonas sp. TaxID=1872588 RepID=UPI0037BEFD7F
MRISALEGARVAVWGYGREGAAALHALRRALPAQRFSLICSPDEASAARSAFGDAIDIETAAPEVQTLTRFDWVVKSPGISPYRSPAPEALAAGLRFTSGTALWFAERQARDPQVSVVCITGSKGKSTTTALIAHLLRADGRRVALAGNIGLPLLELLEQPAPEFYVIELSSYQTADALRPAVAVLLNLYPEHLDWHGTEQRYYDDKCALVERVEPGLAVLNAQDARLAQRFAGRPSTRWFGTVEGWHVSGEGAERWICRGELRVLSAAALPLPGAHNAGNLCAALTAIDALGIDAVALAAHAQNFRALPHRLQPLGERAGRLYVNDSISTTPHASLAALAHYRERRVAILLGGFERGLDWSEFVAAMRDHAPAVIVCLGANGPRIATALRGLGEAGFELIEANDLPSAVSAAELALDATADTAASANVDRGVVLLSPGAPSFGEFRDYAERGRRFAELAGFDAERIGSIPGLGINSP